jgi:hypothetical protein
LTVIYQMPHPRKANPPPHQLLLQLPLTILWVDGHLPNAPPTQSKPPPHQLLLQLLLTVHWVDGHLHVAAAALHAHLPDDGQARVTQPLVLLVRQRLSRRNCKCNISAAQLCEQGK